MRERHRLDLIVGYVNGRGSQLPVKIREFEAHAIAQAGIRPSQLELEITESVFLNDDAGTDAMFALLDFGFGQLRLERLWLEVYDFNGRARRSYDKCGFTLEGVERHAIYKFGRYIDVQLMSILFNEWAAQPRKKMWEYTS